MAVKQDTARVFVAVTKWCTAVLHCCCRRMVFGKQENTEIIDMMGKITGDGTNNKTNKRFRVRDLNPGLSGESRVS